MLKKVTITQGQLTLITYEYTLYAFTTDKGLFTLSGSFTNGGDIFKQLTPIVEFHEWQRTQLYDWLNKGKIKPVDEANRIDWHTNPTLLKKFLKTL